MSNNFLFLGFLALTFLVLDWLALILIIASTLIISLGSLVGID